MLTTIATQYFSHIMVFLVGLFIGVCGEAWARKDWYNKIREAERAKKD